MSVPDDTRDQAAGLRDIFRHARLEPAVHVIACPSRPALAVSLVAALAKSLSEISHTTLWIDEVGFDGREGWPFATRIRFDLSQALAGFVDIRSAIQPITSDCWYGLSLQAPPKTAGATTITSKLRDSTTILDSILVSSDGKGPQTWGFYGAEINLCFISDCTDKAIDDGILWMINTHAVRPARSWSVVLVGDPTERAAAFSRLTTAASKYISTAVMLRGEVPGAIANLSLTGIWATETDVLSALATHAST